VAIPGYVDGFYNNKCVQGTPVPYINIDTCDVNNPNPALVPWLQSNQVYNINQTLNVGCGKDVISEAQFQEMGFDGGTSVYPLPSDEEIIGWAQQLLF